MSEGCSRFSQGDEAVLLCYTISPLLLQTVLVESAGFVLDQTDLRHLSILKLLM